MEKSESSGKAASVLLDIRDGLATITLNRPDRNNGLDSEMTDRMRDAVLHLAARDDIRVVLLRGAGPRFCVGVHLGWLQPEAPGCDRRMQDALAGLNVFVQQLRKLPAIVVAAVQGAAAGGGFALMCAADMVVAHEGLLLTTAYARIGGTPDSGLSYHLPRLLGERKALELLLLSEPLDAATALRIGLVNQVASADQFESTVDLLTERLLKGPPQAHATIKRLVTRAMDTTFAEQLDQELQGMIGAHSCGEILQGVLAFKEKRAPDFSATNRRD